MQEAFPEAEVHGYEDLIESLSLPDPDDRHVLAAAIRCGAAVIVTSNLRDFPPDVLAQYEIELRSPDDFALNTFQLYEDDALAALKLMRSGYTKPSMSPNDLIVALMANNMVLFRAALKTRVNSL